MFSRVKDSSIGNYDKSRKKILFYSCSISSLIILSILSMRVLSPSQIFSRKIDFGLDEVKMAAKIFLVFSYSMFGSV